VLAFRSIARSRSPERAMFALSSALLSVNTVTRFRPREMPTYHWLPLVAVRQAESATSTVSTVLPCEAYEVTHNRAEKSVDLERGFSPYQYRFRLRVSRRR